MIKRLGLEADHLLLVLRSRMCVKLFLRRYLYVVVTSSRGQFYFSVDFRDIYLLFFVTILYFGEKLSTFK
jgi:hypothetical protein